MHFSALFSVIATAASVVRAVPLETRSVEDIEFEKRAAGFRFNSTATAPFVVKSLPDVPFDIGEMYSGLIPITTGSKARELFFIFQPTVGAPVDEITVWLNGGPGCSSLEGFFQENGLFLWQEGSAAPTVNPYSWVNETNMLWYGLMERLERGRCANVW